MRGGIPCDDVDGMKKTAAAGGELPPRAGEERKRDGERGRKERERERKRSGRREREGSELLQAAGVMAGRRGAEEAIGRRSGQIILCCALYTLPFYFFLIKN